MNNRKAAEILGVELQGLGDCDIDDAFRAAVFKHHPDTGDGDSDALDSAKKARDTLRTFVAKGGLPPACGACGGSGHVKGRFGEVVCPRCKGAKV